MMTKKLFLTLSIIALLTSCATRSGNNAQQNANTFDEGVVINGVRWATRNVAAPGTFAPYPHSAGMFFQWNRRTGFSATTPEAGVPIENWHATPAEGTTWTRANDPCPQGWRVPTMAELIALHDAGSEWTNSNGVYGRYFGTGQNRIFLPASGSRDSDVLGNVNVGVHGFFWSSTESSSVVGAQGLWVSGGFVSVGPRLHRSGALSVRCVAE